MFFCNWAPECHSPKVTEIYQNVPRLNVVVSSCDGDDIGRHGQLALEWSGASSREKSVLS